MTREEKDTTIKLVRLPDGRLAVADPPKLRLLLKCCKPALWGLALLAAAIVLGWL